MAITYVGGQVGGRAGSTSTSNVTFALTGGTNSTPQAGDLVIIGCTVASQARTPACAISGYTAETQINANGTTYDTSLNMSRKFMGGTPDTTFTLPSTGNIADAQRWTVQVWRGVDATTPFDATPVPASGTGTGRPNPGSITPTTTGAFVGIIGAGAAATGAAYTAPANYTTNFLTGTTADTNDAMIGSGYRAWTSGAEDPAAYTGGTANAVDSWAAFTYALRPAVNNYPLTCLGGSYSLTGSSAGIDYVGAKPVRISTTLWQQDTLGTSGTPGAKAITVPSDAQGVVVQFHSGQSTTPQTLSISSDFTGTFTVANSTTQNGCSLGYAVVTSTGAKNLTLAWTVSAIEGPSVYISFIKNINTSDWVREVAVVGTNTSGTSASNVFDTSVDDLLLVVNDQDSGGGGAPATISGFTSLGTTADTYGLPSRFQSCNSPGATTTTVTGTTTNYDVLSGISIKPNVSGAYSLVASGGSYSLTGSQAVLKRNRTLTTSGGSYTLIGQQTVITWAPAVNHYTLTALSGTYSYSGASVGISRNRKLTSNGGAYIVTGGTAALLRSKKLVLSGGAYSVTGASANVNRNRKLTAIAGSYLVAGSSISISRNRNLIAQGGIYTYTGQQIVITHTAGSVNYTLTALGGAYAIDGSTALLARNRTLVSSGGSYSYTGSSASLLRSKYLSTTGGVYSVTGATANLFKSKRLIASGGSYIYTGNTVTLKRSKYLNVSGGSYSLVGSSATITWAGVGGAVWPPTHVVLLGTVYGPTGTEYTGTLDVNGIKYDITTGQLVKPLNDKVVMSL